MTLRKVTRKVNGVAMSLYCDENGNIYATREQVGTGLGFRGPIMAVGQVHKRHPELFACSMRIKWPESKVKVYLYTLAEIKEFCRLRRGNRGNAYWNFLQHVRKSVKVGLEGVA